MWEYFHNSLEYGRWVFVRDHKLDLVYFGWIETFSESGEKRELLISEVEVYSNQRDERLYAIPVMYVARERHDLTIEVPDTGSEEAEEPS